MFLRQLPTLLATRQQKLLPVALLALSTVSIVSCGTGDTGSQLHAALPSDVKTQLVRVEDTSGTSVTKRLMLVTGGRGYYIETGGQSNCAVLGAFGFPSPDINSLPTWQMTSQEFINAKPALQPTLQCVADPTQQAGQIRGLRVIAEQGQASRYFFLFPGPAQKNKYYELGCRELMTAFSWQEASALPITATTLADADLVADLNCRTGTPFPPNIVRPPVGSFQDWCGRTNLSEGDRYTMDVLLQKSGKSTCAEAEAELRKPEHLNLDLSGQSLDSIGPLESLQWVRGLDLSNNTLTNITGLDRLTRLTSLKLKNNGIKDIRALAALSNLKTLDLDDNDISSITPLRNLRFLDTVSVKFNPRLKPFDASHTFFETCLLKSAMLPAAQRTVNAVLESVGSSKCGQATDILESTFDTLDFTGITPPIEDVAPLASLRSSQIKVINLASHPFKDARPLAALTELTGLNLDNSGVDGDLCPYEAGPQVLRDICHVRAQTFLYWCQNPQISATANSTVESIRRETSLASEPCPQVFAAAKNGVSRGPTEVAKLHLMDLNGSDLRPLRGLSGLKTLWLGSSSPISNLDVLRHMPELETLYIYQGVIGSLAPLSSNVKLKSLVISGGSLTDLNPLSSLRNLELLYLIDAKVSDVSPLKTLVNLKTLFLFGNPSLTTLSGLHTLTRLEELNIATTQVSEIAALTGMTSLKTLHLGQTRITDLTPLRNIATLESLNASGEPIANLEGLQNKPVLKNLTLRNTLVSDLAPLSQSTLLERLQVFGSTIRSLAPLAALTNMLELTLESREAGSTGTVTLDLAPLQGMSRLDSLHIESYRLPQLAPLTLATSLRDLRLPFNAITNVSALASLTNLRILDVTFNSIDSFVPLSNLEDMSALYATGSGVDYRNIHKCPRNSPNDALNSYCATGRSN